ILPASFLVARLLRVAYQRREHASRAEFASATRSNCGPIATISTRLGPMASRAVDLVGRRAELSWLRERLRLAAQGSPQCVLLSGEAGIGKTRLAAELSDEA